MDQRFPEGEFNPKEGYTEAEREGLIRELAAAPARLRAAVEGLSDARLDTPYRAGGWTVRQVTHHLPDSHMNGMIRMKLALTEDEPLIKTYMEDRWANLADYEGAPDVSLALLDAVHARWVTVWRSLDAADFERKFRHPDWGTLKLEQHLALYAWHGRHHVAHITSLRGREGW
jgi:uncharacterized damage-inducible protein DinB